MDLLCIGLGLASFAAFCLFVVAESGVAFMLSFPMLIGSIFAGVEAKQPISETRTEVFATIMKTPTAVIVEARVGDRILRETFTDIPTYNRVQPDTKVIYHVVTTGWGDRGRLVLDLP